jgi:hypothetical protein
MFSSSLSQELSVQGNTQLVITESTTLGQLVNQQNIVNLPLKGRDVQQLAFLGGELIRYLTEVVVGRDRGLVSRREGRVRERGPTCWRNAARFNLGRV